MRILVVNDDGIQAEGIRLLAQEVSGLGEVWVIAPDSQCSAMSHRITVHGDIHIRESKFPVKGVWAYCVSGTPADCVKVGIGYLMPEKPDVVLSGINHGYNIGFDIAYSGTVGAAIEAVLNGIPAIAFSNEGNGIYDVAKEYLHPVVRDLLGRTISAGEIWNVNFPGCTLAEYQGIREDVSIGQRPFYLDHYEKEEQPDGSVCLTSRCLPDVSAEAGTDIDAVLGRCIAIGKIKSHVITK